MQVTILKIEKKYYNVKKSGKKQLCRIATYGCVQCGKECRKELRKMNATHHFTGKCKKCINSRKPFESLHTSFVRQANDRGIPVHINYSQFLEFTKITNCFYCGETIPWREFGTCKKESRGYFLDRKDNALSYSFTNCVVCCKLCNFTKANRYTFEEFCLLSPILRQIKQKRQELP